LNQVQTERKLGSWAGLTIDLSQFKDKSCYYHSFKT